MRRGHRRGGWRSEPPRNFWGKTAEAAHFRPPQPYVRTPRYPQPFRNPYPRPLLFNQNNIGISGQIAPEYKDRNTYQVTRYGNNPKQYQAHHKKQTNRNDNNEFFINSTSNAYNQLSHNIHNSDLFLRQINLCEPPPFPTKSPYEKSTDFNQKDYNRIPQLLSESAARPNSSDYFENSSFSSKDTQETFRRSVGDTVDMIKKRLRDRHQNVNQQPSITQSSTKNDNLNNSKPENSHHGTSREQMPKRKLPKCHSVDVSVDTKANCNKLKDKIIHQLFKMDKEGIHKLLDNPKSSAKFEYAISSLLTESQNSFNRYTRAAAERSLNTANIDQSQYKNEDTIYEDTFLKQMQCILDPNDTILLTDIKPIIMAELNKVLEIDEEQRTEHAYENDAYYSNVIDPEDKKTSLDMIPIYDDNDYDYHDDRIINCDTQQRMHNTFGEAVNNEHVYESQIFPCQEDDFLLKKNFVESLRRKEDKPMQDRCLQQTNNDYNNARRNSRNSTSSNPTKNDYLENEKKNTKKDIPLFDTSTEVISDGEDPFDELDKQYHVAVDPTLIENDSVVDHVVLNPHHSNYQNISPLENDSVDQIKCNEKNNTIPKVEPVVTLQRLDNQLEKVNMPCNSKATSIKVENGTSCTVDKSDKMETENNNKIHRLSKEDNSCCKPDKKNRHHVINSQKTPEKYNSSSSTIQKLISETSVPEKSSEQKNSRKRSTDLRESHRKEKRKKNDANKINSKEKILNKNIIINVTDCSKPSKKCDSSAKSIFNLFFSKDSKEGQKQAKQNDVDERYSEKYVKRRDSPTKSENKDKVTMNRRRSSSTSTHHSTQNSDSMIHSPDNNLLVKNESKSKLTTFDMFTEQPRKLGIHQALRNTASLDDKPKLQDDKISNIVAKPTPLKISKSIKPSSTPRKSKETQTLHTMQVTTRFCQTEVKKLSTRGTQTIDNNKNTSQLKKPCDVYERMKEIDLEIQLLLQEKFKLYNSIDAKDASSAVTNFGMTIVNMAPLEESNKEIASEDLIIENFANLPEEELEKIALGGGQDTISEASVSEGKSRRCRKKANVSNKLKDSADIDENTPLIRCKELKKRSKPDISLIEQILTDDMPLENIISLEDLEITPRRNSKANKKRVSKGKKVNKKHLAMSGAITIKPCSVLLVRADISKYLPKDMTVLPIVEKGVVMEQPEQQPLNEIHFQYDMLVVSEDIVIGDTCEVGKTEEDNEVLLYENDMSCVGEVVDNSQPSQISVQEDTGQESVICRTYDFSIDGDSIQDIMKVSGNVDAVLAIECIENTFLAACLDGNVYYYSGDGQLLKTLRGSNLAVTCLTIVEEKYGTTVYTGSLDSRIRYYDLQTGLEKGPECNVLSPIQTMDRAWGTIFVGTRTGFVLQFECKNNMLIPVSTIKFSENSILALRALKEGPRKVLLVAARSENVTIKDAQTGLLLRTLEGPKMTVYTLLYEEGKVFCGTSSHQIQVFDYASGSHVGEHEGGKGAVCLRASGGLLFAGCYDGCVYVYRGGERTPIAQLRGPAVMLLSLSILGNKLIAGYNDRSLYIWKMPVSILEEMIL